MKIFSLGVDVSYAQGKIQDWKAVKAAGIDFAIIRAGYCYNNGAVKVDTTYHYNMQQALAAGLDVGVYLFSYALTAAAAERSANELLPLIAPYSISMPVIFDIEDSTAVTYTKFTKTLNTSIVDSFLSVIQANGYIGMIYANKSFFEVNLDMKQLAAYEVWVAQWDSACTYTGDYGIWQYSEKGKVNGINTYVDMNYCYKDYPGLIVNPVDPPTVPGDTAAPDDGDIMEKDCENTYYVVVKNDNLTRIAQAHKVPLALLLKVNPQIKNPNLIYPGDRIRVPCMIHD